MDKGRNRSDLLAAGRKKLQQFRQKKDGKGGGADQKGKPSHKAAGKSGTKAVVESARDREPDRPTEAVPASGGDVASSDMEDLPVAAILTRTLTEGDLDAAVDAETGSVGSLDSRPQSNGGVEKGGLPGEGAPGAGLETHGKECSSSGMDERDGSGGYALEVMRQAGGSEDGALRSDELVVDVERNSSAHGAVREDSGVKEANVSLNAMQEADGAGDEFSGSPWRSETDLQSSQGGNMGGSGLSSPVVESKPNVKAVAEKPDDLANQVLDSSSLLPQANQDGGEGCFTSSAGSDAVVAKIGNESEGQIPLIDEKTGMVIDYHKEEKVEERPSRKDDQAQELDIVHLSAAPSEETEVACKEGDAHSGKNWDNMHRTLDVAISESEDGVTSASGRMEGDTRETDQIVKQHLGAIVITENEAGLEVPYSRTVSHLEDVERPPGDKDSSVANVDMLNVQRTVSLSASVSEEDEKLKEHLYSANVTNEVLHRQLKEQAANALSLPEEVRKLQSSAQMTEVNDTSIYQELSYYKSEFQAMTSKKDEVGLLLKSAQGEIEVLNTRISELQSQMDACRQESSAVSTEILDLKAKVAAAERESSDLRKHIIMEEEERKRLEDEKEYFISENMKLSRELSEQKERLVLALDEQMQIERDLEESLMPLEKLSEENLSLSICLDCYRFKLKDLGGLRILLPRADRCQDPANGFDVQNNICSVATEDLQESPGICDRAVQLGSLESSAPLKTEKDQQPLCIGDNDVGDCGTLFIWKRHLKEATEMVMKLEKTIQGMHCQSMSLSRVGGRMAASGVSKLILAFETKGQPDDSLTNDASSTFPLEADDSLDFISSSKEQLKELRYLLEMMDGERENASLLFKDQEERKMHAKELMSECEAQKLENNNLHAKTRELVWALSDCKTVVDALQHQIEDMSRNTGDEVDCFINQVEVLQKEVVSCLSSLEKEQASARDAVLQMIKKLDASTGFLASSDGDLDYLVNASVGAALDAIESLREKLKAVELDCDTKSASYMELHGNSVNLKEINDLAVGELVRIHGCFRELINGSCEKLEEKDASTRNYQWLKVIKQDSEALTLQLEKMLHERVQLLGAKEELEADILKKSLAVEELQGRCNNLEKELANANNDRDEMAASLVGMFKDLKDLSNRCSILAKKFDHSDAGTLPEDIPNSEDIFNAKNLMLESINSFMSHIEASVLPLLQKYDDATKEISLSKNYLGELESLANVSGDILSMPLHILLKETIIPKLMELSEMRERFLSSSSTLFEKGNEIQILKNSLSEMEEALQLKFSEFDLKVAELEQSEQKLSSVREKLSIAVAKGKGLVVQRDNLKQSLVEKTNELEKCLQELRTKEMMLHETETKLKSYPEVDRVEALESELAYIRNSATAFRDSFLLKDSMIQRIEEILEDLDLPEHFYSKDIAEKIQLLARSAANNSFMVTDWDQRSPAGESHPDESSGVSDALREDQSTVPGTETDESRRRFDELQRKFYGLAEHNDMLEQSLMERHSVIQRWEELLDMIDMPAYLKSMEPVVRLEWLGKALPEVQREHNSLLAKVEDLEESNESLIRNLQELQRKISELEAALISAENERNSLSTLVSKLGLENSELSGKGSQNEELQRRMSELEVALISAENERNTLSTLVSKLRFENSELLDKESQNEELQRQISELERAFVSVENERGIFSAQIDKLRVEISNKETQNGLERLRLQKDIADLQEELAENISRLKDIQIFIDDSVSENVSAWKTSSDNPIDDLECSLRKLIDDYKALIEKSKSEGSGKLAADRNNMVEEQKMKDLLDDKEKDLMVLKEQLDEASHSLVLLKEESSATAEKHQLLLVDMEEMVSQRDTLLADNEATVKKCQDLQMELLALKSQFNEASHRMVLVEEEKNSLSEGKCALELDLDEMMKERDSLLLEREATLGKCQDLLSEIQLLSKQRDTLVEQLNQEGQRSASVREKLNVAVRKGKALVQQRDGLKQAVEDMNSKLDQLQNQLNQTTLENSSLRNKLIETESDLQDNKQVLNDILNALHAIDIAEVPPGNPVQMIEGIQKLLNDCLMSALSKEQEAKKSRHAAELLLAELNEVQERADNLQEELSKAEITLVECCRERDEVKVARADAISKLEQVMGAQSEERNKEAAEILFLRSRIDEFRNGWLNILDLIYGIFSKDHDFIYSLATTAESVLRQVNGTTHSDNKSVPSHRLSHRHSSGGARNEDKTHMANLAEHLKEQVMEHLHHATQCLNHCTEELGDLKEMVDEHYAIVEQQARSVAVVMEATQREITLLSTSSEPLSSVVNRLEISKKDKETEISMLQRCLVLLFEACKSSILQIENRKSGEKGSEFKSESVKIIMNLPNSSKKEGPKDKARLPITEDHIKMVAEMLLSAVRGFENMFEEIAEDKHMKLKSLVSDLQRELQEKDIQKNRICAELVSQIRDAESLAKKHYMDLESARREVHDLESQLKVVEDEKKLLEQRVNDLKDLELSSKDLQGRVNSLSESIAAKDQEIEALMQALDEEESQMESLQARNQELEKLLEEKTVALESLEASRAKALVKLSTTVNKFDELHQLSENLLVEVESLQSQLQERDSEISFLRQEVTRCTKDVLAEQKSQKKISNDVHELQLWIAAMFSRFGVHDVNFENQAGIQLDAYKEFLDERLSSVVVELNNLRVNSQNKDALLQTEKGRVDELLRKTEALETSLHDKETQIALYQRTRDSGQLSTAESSEPLEIESVRNKGATSSSVVPLIRGGRRIISDQVAVDVDLEQGDSLEDEDDDKAHGFKSLTMSKVVPKFTRPVAERVDGLWVSVERLLMRQPSLRLGLIIYWIALHAMLAASI